MARLRNKDGDDFARRHLRWIDEQDDLSSLSIEGFTLAPAFLDEVLARLAPAGVEHLHLWDAGLGAAGARRIATSPAIRRLQTLDLHGNAIGDDGAFALAEAPPISAVRRLIVSDNQIRDAGALALASSPHLAGLDELGLSDNRIGEARAPRCAPGSATTAAAPRSPAGRALPARPPRRRARGDPGPLARDLEPRHPAAGRGRRLDLGAAPRRLPRRGDVRSSSTARRPASSTTGPTRGSGRRR